MKTNYVTLSTRVTEAEEKLLRAYLKEIGHTNYSILKEFVNGLLLAAKEAGVHPVEDMEELPPIPTEDDANIDSELLG